MERKQEKGTAKLEIKPFELSWETVGRTVLIATRDAKGKPNAMTAGWLQLGGLWGKPVLTISEAEKFDVTDAVINFVAVETRLGFSINLDAADSGNLQVSSRLLSLAHSVRTTRAQRQDGS